MAKLHAAKFAAENAARKARNRARHEREQDKLANYAFNAMSPQKRRNAKRAIRRLEETKIVVDPLHNWPNKPQYKAIPDGNFMSSSATIHERDNELGRWLHIRTYNAQRANTIIHNILHSEGIRSNPVMDENALSEARFSHTRSNSFHLMQVKAALINGHATPRDYGVEF